MNKKLLILVSVLAIVGIAFAFMRSQPIEDIDDNVAIDRYSATLSGTYVCLPHTDTTGPQTEECAGGIKTASGEYYALDFNLSSQTVPDLTVGDMLEANGTVTPIAMLSTNMWQRYPIVGIFSVTDSIKKINDNTVASGKSITVSTSLGNEVSGIGVTITPKEIISDSRCPSGVQCIWAGTVEVKTVLSTQVSHGENVLKLNQPTIFGDYTVALKEVTPHPKIGEKIADSSYRFTFEVQRN